MNKNNIQKLRTEIGHRKLDRRPDRCGLDPPLNPSLTNIFTTTPTNQYSSQTTTKYNDPSNYQQLSPNNSLDSTTVLCSLPSSAAVTKPKLISSFNCNQNISNKTDFQQSISTEPVDQMSNNFISNVQSGHPVLEYVKVSVIKTSQEQSKTLSLFNADANDIYSNLKTTTNNKQINKSDTITHPSNDKQQSAGNSLMKFNQNNPFLNYIESISDVETDESHLYESELSFSNKTLEPLKPTDAIEKREKFSNTSASKICLVVSPPNNKVFQASEFTIVLKLF